MDAAERILIIGGICIVAAFYLAVGGLLAHLLGLGDSPFLWVSVMLAWPAVVAFLAFLGFIGVAVVARVLEALPGRRA